MRLARGWSVVLVMAAACGRTELDSPPLVAFATNPLVKLHISSLVTGP